MKFQKEVFKKKAKEPSTWAGVVGLITVALGIPVSPEAVVLVVTSIVSIFVTEK